MSYLQPMDTRQYLYCLKPKPEYAEKAGVIKGVTVIGKLDIVWKTNLGERGRLQTSQLQRMVWPFKSTPCLFWFLFHLPPFSLRHQDTETSDCLWRWFLTPSTLRNPLTSSVRSPTAGTTVSPVDTMLRVWIISISWPCHCSERTMDLVLEMCNTASIHWCGTSGRKLGKLSPAVSLSLPLTLFSSVQGLQVRDWGFRKRSVDWCSFFFFFFGVLMSAASFFQSVSGLRLKDTFLKRTYEYDDIAQVCVICPYQSNEH